MVKSEIIRELAHVCNFRISDVETLIDEYGNLMCACLDKGEEFIHTGLFSVKVKNKLGRIQHNPKTGENFTSGDRPLVQIRKGTRLKSIGKDTAQ